MNKTRKFHYKDKNSDKFWHITLNGTEYTTEYGKTGSKPRTDTNSYSNEDETRKKYEQVIKSKIKKGYKEVTTDVGEAKDPSADQADEKAVPTFSESVKKKPREKSDWMLKRESRIKKRKENKNSHKALSASEISEIRSSSKFMPGKYSEQVDAILDEIVDHPKIEVRELVLGSPRSSEEIETLAKSKGIALPQQYVDFFSQVGGVKVVWQNIEMPRFKHVDLNARGDVSRLLERTLFNDLKFENFKDYNIGFSEYSSIRDAYGYINILDIDSILGDGQNEDTADELRFLQKFIEARKGSEVHLLPFDLAYNQSDRAGEFKGTTSTFVPKCLLLNSDGSKVVGHCTRRCEQ